jgi:hypothetical protein
MASPGKRAYVSPSSAGIWIIHQVVAGDFDVLGRHSGPRATLSVRFHRHLSTNLHFLLVDGAQRLQT